MKIISCFAMLSLCFTLLISSEVRAQGSTTAAMNGVVLDEKGNPLTEATVIAIHIPSGTQYAYPTRDDGQFNFPAVRTGGPYTIIVSYIGYKKTTLNDIFLSLGQNRDLVISVHPQNTIERDRVLQDKAFYQVKAVLMANLVDI